MPVFEELKRRNVVRVGLAYIVTAWLLLQVADIVLDATTAPDWVMQVFMLVLALAFPVALVFAWAFELTPDGLKRESEVDRSRSISNLTARRLDLIIIVLLIFALAAFAWDRLVYSPEATAIVPGAEIAEAEVAQQLETATTETGSSAGTGASIAVLPFVNLSADEDQEYFSDGISEELLNVLAKYPRLRVAARTSSFQFKGRNEDITEIARQLNVNHVLEGSVRKSGTRLRITAQLIDAETGFHLWSETYDRELEDIFAIQDEISAAIGTALRAELSLDPQSAVPAPRVASSDNTAAYEALLQGRHLINQRGNRNIRSAVEHLERCVRLDSDFAPCHAWLSIGYTMLLSSPGTYGDLSLLEVKSRAIPEYEKALELDPNLAEAHGAVALLAINSNEFETAMASTRRALELNPVYVDALNWRQIASGSMGQYVEAQSTIEQILEIDPLSVIGRLNYVAGAIVSDPDRARRVAMSLVEGGNSWAGYAAMSFVEAVPSGDFSGSIEWALRAYQIEPRDEFVNQSIMSMLATLGEPEEALRISGKNHYLVYFTLGRYADAISDLEASIALDSENVVYRPNLADSLASAGRCEEAMVWYQGLVEESPIDMVFDTFNNTATSQVRMAQCLVQLGKDAEAKLAIERQSWNMEQRLEAKLVSGDEYYAQAMVEALLGEERAMVESLRAAVDLGFRRTALFDETFFKPFAATSEMQALQAEMQAMLDKERDETLVLICHKNPAFDTWQPRKETCEGVPAPN